MKVFFAVLVDIVEDFPLIRIMYTTVCLYSAVILLILSNFVICAGQMFLAIWPLTEPASREVSEAL